MRRDTSKPLLRHTHTLPSYGCDVTPFIKWAKLSYDSELLRANWKWSSNLKRNRFHWNKIRFYNWRHLIFHTHTHTQRWRWLISNKFICTIQPIDEWFYLEGILANDTKDKFHHDVFSWLLSEQNKAKKKEWKKDASGERLEWEREKLKEHLKRSPSSKINICLMSIYFWARVIHSDQ